MINFWFKMKLSVYKCAQTKYWCAYILKIIHNAGLSREKKLRKYWNLLVSIFSKFCLSFQFLKIFFNSTMAHKREGLTTFKCSERFCLCHCFTLMDFVKNLFPSLYEKLPYKRSYLRIILGIEWVWYRNHKQNGP